MPNDQIIIPKKLLILLFLNFFAAFFLLLFTQMTSNQSQTAKSKASPPESPAAIVGGEPAKPGEFPYFAALFDKTKAGLPDPSNDNFNYDIEDGFLCGGVLIKPDWVLTAAHCLKYIYNHPDYLGVAMDLTEKAGQLDPVNVQNSFFDVTDIFVYPAYPPQNEIDAYSYDIALLKLDRDVAGIALPVIPEDDDLYSSDNHIVTPGFGCVGVVAGQRSNPIESNNLQKLSLPIMLVHYANNYFTFGYEDRKNPPKEALCSGDSGSPVLFSPDKQIYYLLGISIASGYSYGVPIPNTATKVNSYNEWINRVIAGNLACGDFPSILCNENLTKYGLDCGECMNNHYACTEKETSLSPACTQLDCGDIKNGNCQDKYSRCADGILVKDITCNN